MGKIYCTECGKELEDTVKFCSNCGTPTDDVDSEFNESVDNNVLKDKSAHNEKTTKSNNPKKLDNSKVLVITGLCIIIFILGILIVGSSFMNTANDAGTNDATSEPQPFIENIYGINFSIPGYFKNVESTDYEKDETGLVSCTRTYERPDGTGIAIIVATNPDGWDLDHKGIDMTVNGHHGKLTYERDVFGYISGDKLVSISGTSQEELESIIIE